MDYISFVSYEMKGDIETSNFLFKSAYSECFMGVEINLLV